MDIPFHNYIFSKSITKLIEDATALFTKYTSLKGNKFLNELKCCDVSDIKDKPEYVSDLMHDLEYEIEEIKNKQTLSSTKSTSKRRSKLRTRSKSRKSRKSSKKQH